MPVQINSVFKNFDTQLHWTARCLIRVCLLLSLWNLPFPWLHNHDQHQEAQENSHWFYSHIDEFHAAVDEEVTGHGWHLHFVYFGAENSNNPHEDNFPAQHHFIVGETSQPLPASESVHSTFSHLAFASVGFDHVFAPSLSLTAPPAKDREAHEHFLQSFHNRSLRDLISVSLC